MRGISGVADDDPVRQRLGAEVERLESDVRAAVQRTEELEEELAQVRASERWRLGGFVATPAAALKRLFIH